MKKPVLAALVLILCMMSVQSPASAQDAASQPSSNQSSQASIDQNIELMRKDIRSQKKQLIAANLPLTDAESQAFWPVYDRYAADLATTNNEKLTLLKEYAQGYTTMTDAQADDWSTRVLKLDAALPALRLKYRPEFRKVLPAKKAALYQQVERQAQMIIDTQLAMEIPLVQP